MSRRTPAAGVLTAVMLLFAAATVSAQTSNAASGRGPGGISGGKVAITPLFAPPGDSAAGKIASAATGALKLMLHLAGSLTVVDAPQLDPIMGYQKAVALYRRVGARIGMFGTVTPESGGAYTITVQYWQSTKPSAPPATFKRKVSTPAGAVKAADELAVKVVSAVARRKLSTGTLEVKDTEGIPDYSIYVDGHLAAHNAPRIQLLSGKRTVTVVVPDKGEDRPIGSFHVDVKPGKTISVAVTRPVSAQAEKKPVRTQGAQPEARPGAVRQSPQTGSLAVTSSPDGATVLLDGRRVGTTPLTLAKVGAGSHVLRIVHNLFLPVVRSVRVEANHHRELHVRLAVNRQDPALARRLVSPLGVGGSSLLWSAIQTAHFAGLMAAAGNTQRTTASFLYTQTAFTNKGPGLTTLLDLDLNLVLTRIGSRLAGDSTLTTIGDVWAATAAAAGTAGLVGAERSGSPQASQAWLNVAEAAAIVTVGGMLFDAGSSALSASGADRRLLAYVSSHGALPPARKAPTVHAHEVILETGGNSLLRVGFRQPLVPSYLSFEETLGLGTESMSSFDPMLTGGAVVSYNPWGPKTGRLRPVLFVGVRATTNFSNSGSSIDPEFGTGNEWIGRYFDIFTRGGLGYNVAGNHWDEFFTVGTRLF